MSIYQISFETVPHVWFTTTKKDVLKNTDETDQASEPESEMAETLEPSEKEFKTTIINMLSAVMDKTNQKNQIGNVSREMEILRKLKNKCQLIKHTKI